MLLVARADRAFKGMAALMAIGAAYCTVLVALEVSSSRTPLTRIVIAGILVAAVAFLWLISAICSATRVVIVEMESLKHYMASPGRNGANMSNCRHPPTLDESRESGDLGPEAPHSGADP